MPKWWVITPEYGTVVPVLDDGTGPEEFGCDVVEVEAPTRREALVLGLRELKKVTKGWINWYRDDTSNPFTGLRAELQEEAQHQPTD